jgi:hypothetical protein
MTSSRREEDADKNNRAANFEQSDQRQDWAFARLWLVSHNNVLL